MVAPFPSWQKNFYDKKEILYQCFKLLADNTIIHTRNGDVRVHFGFVSPLYIQQFAMQMQLLVCHIQARVGILSDKDAFDKISCWQDYPVD